MSLLNYNEVLTAQSQDARPIAPSSSISIIPDNNIIVLPNHLLYVGKTIRVTWFGQIWLNSSGGANFQFSIDLGTAGSTNVFNFLSGPTTAVTPLNVWTPFLVRGIFTIRTQGTGTSSTAWGIFQLCGIAQVGSSIPTVGGVSTSLIPAGATAVSNGFDYSVANWFNIRLNFGSTTTVYQNLQYVLEALN